MSWLLLILIKTISVYRKIASHEYLACSLLGCGAVYSLGEIIIRRELVLDVPVSDSSNSLFKVLRSRLRPLVL